MNEKEKKTLKERNPEYLQLRCLISVGRFDMAYPFMAKENSVIGLDTDAELIRLALSGDFLEIIRFLAFNQVYVCFLNARGRNGLRVLHYAVAISGLESIKAVVDAGLSVFSVDEFINAQDDFGNTPLFLVEYRKAILQQTLLRMMLTGASEGERSITRAETKEIQAIEEKAEQDMQPIIRFLINKGADSTIKNRFRQTAEIWAAAQASEISENVRKIIAGKKQEVLFYWPPLYHEIIPPPSVIKDDEEKLEISSA